VRVERYQGPPWRLRRAFRLQVRRTRRAGRSPLLSRTLPLPAFYRAPLEAWRRDQEALALKVGERLGEGYLQAFRRSLAATLLKVLKTLLGLLLALVGLPPEPEPHEGFHEPLEAEERAPPLPLLLIKSAITPTAGP